MKKHQLLLLALVLALFPLACGDSSDTGDGGQATPAPQQTEQAQVDETGGLEADDGEHLHEGEEFDLGTKTLGDFEVQVIQAGEIEVGAEAIFEIMVLSEAKPAAIRLTIVSQTEETSITAKANKISDMLYDAHIGELPDPLAAGSRVRVEVEAADGATLTAEFELHLH